MTHGENSQDQAWTALYIIRFFRNLVAFHGDSGMEAIRGAITTELLQSLPSIVANIKTHIGNSAAQQTSARLEEILPTDQVVA